MPRRATGALSRRPTILAAGWLSLYALLIELRPFQGHTQEIVTAIVFDVAGLTAAVSLWLLAGRSGRARGALRVLAASLAFWVAGDAAWDTLDIGFPGDVAFPSAADWLYLVYYPFAVVALRRLMRLHVEGRRNTLATLDAAIVAVGSFALAWYVIGGPLAFAPDSTTLARAVGLAYPAGDLLVLFMLALLAFRGGLSRVPALRMLAWGLALFAAGDVAYAYLSIGTSYDAGSFIDLTWLGAYLVIALAARHPSLERLGQPHPVPERPVRARTVALVASGLLGPVLALIALARDEIATLAGLLAFSSVMVVLVVARLRATGRENERLAEKLARQDHLLRLLLDRVSTAQEVERSRVAAEIHDGVLQDVAALVYDLERASTQLARAEWDRAGESVDSVRERLIETVSAIRHLLWDLRPPVLDDFGLAPAIGRLLRGRRASGEPRAALEAADLGEIHPRIQALLYRICQEAVNNVRRHANATTISVTLRRDGESIRMTIDDNGRGFDPEPPERLLARGHLGLQSMRERAEAAGGRFEVRTEPGRGTRVLAEVPAGVQEPARAAT